MTFNAIIEKDKDKYFAYIPELKCCVSEGNSCEEAYENIKEACELYVETLENDELKALKLKKTFISPIEISMERALRELKNDKCESFKNFDEYKKAMDNI